MAFYEKEGSPSPQSNGNPIWSVQCVVDGIDVHVEYCDVKKKQAKKAAAYEMLQIIASGKSKILENIINE